MRRIFHYLALLVFAAPAAIAQLPQVVVSSPAFAAAEIESVHTLDGTRVYRLTVDADSRKLSAGTVVEYEILMADGTAAGGGMFTASPAMMSADGETLSALTGLGGLELSPRHQVLVKLAELTSPSADFPPGGRHPAERIVEPQIVDTCTFFCDRCSEKASSLCSNGVQTYTCSCSGEDRSCSFNCSTRPPV